MSERCARCGAKKREHYDGVQCPTSAIGTYSATQTYAPVAPEEPLQAATIFRDVELTIGDNNALPLKHRFRLILKQQDTHGADWKIVDSYRLQEVPEPRQAVTTQEVLQTRLPR